MRSVVLAISLLALAATTEAQDEPVEFGVRFQPHNFEPFAYRGFSYSGQTFRGGFGQSIQFSRITFPSLSSRAVRREFLSRARSTPVATTRRERLEADPIPESRETVLARRFAPERVASKPSAGDVILRRRVAVVESQRADRSRLLGESRFASAEPDSRTAERPVGVASNAPDIVRFPSRASRLAAVERSGRPRTADRRGASLSRIR